LLLRSTSAASLWNVCSGRSEGEIDAHLRALQTALNQVVRLWANNYRFASEERLRSHLKRVTGYKRIGGDYLKEQARRLLDSAQRFIDKGVLQWHV
jgi:hypothetical protein